MLPSVSAGRNDGSGSRNAFSSTNATNATPSVSAIVAPTIAPNSASGSVSFDRLSKTRHGPATYMITRVTNGRSKGTPDRRQT